MSFSCSRLFIGSNWWRNEGCVRWLKKEFLVSIILPFYPVISVKILWWSPKHAQPRGGPWQGLRDADIDPFSIILCDIAWKSLFSSLSLNAWLRDEEKNLRDLVILKKKILSTSFLMKNMTSRNPYLFR